MTRKLSIIAAIVFVILIGIAYLSYQYYLRTQKTAITTEQGIKKTELPQEEIKKIIERNLPEPNTKGLSEEEKQKILKHQQ